MGAEFLFFSEADRFAFLKRGENKERRNSYAVCVYIYLYMDNSLEIQRFFFNQVQQPKPFFLGIKKHI